MAVTLSYRVEYRVRSGDDWMTGEWHSDPQDAIDELSALLDSPVNVSEWYVIQREVRTFYSLYRSSTI